ncbi:MAG: dihydrolipoamide acetyltransferase family protein [Acidimicrobiia bacterium]
MRVEFRLPDVGEGLEEGEIVRWLVAVGDQVGRDQPLVEVQTDKATVELPSPTAARVVSLGFAAGAMVKVGEVLVVLDAEDASGVPTDPGVAAAGLSRPSDPEATARPKASPSVRRLATERGIDLATVTGTGPGGRVLAADLETTPAAAPATAPAEPAAGRLEPGRHPLRGIRRLTAEAMTRSWSEIPHITAMDEADATALLDARRHLDGVSLPAFFVAACARALRRHPEVNASVDTAAGEIVVHAHCHIGVAVATGTGLVVPVVRDADRRSLPDLTAEIARLVGAARDGRLDLADLRDGTFTVTNYGSLGGRFATPLIRPPEAGIMGFGAIRPRPLVVDGQVVARPTLPYCFSADHRLIDGDLAAAFAEEVAGLLTAPIRLLSG